MDFSICLGRKQLRLILLKPGEFQEQTIRADGKQAITALFDRKLSNLI